MESVRVGVAALASRQHGVVSVAQLHDLGLSRDAIQTRARGGRLHRLHRGVYAVGHVALTKRSRQLAAVLAAGPGALLSHRSAGALWAIARSRGGAGVEVTAPRGRRAREGFTLHRSSDIPPQDRAVVDGVPVTSVARTLVDLADVLTERRLADAVHEAEVQRVFDLTEVNEVLARLPGRRGRHRLTRVLAAYGDGPTGTRNRAERLFLEICARHGVPTPQANVTVGGYELDFLWPDAGLAVELDGAATHHTVRRYHGDRRRDRALRARHGIETVRVTWPDLVEGGGEPLARELRDILGC